MSRKTDPTKKIIRELRRNLKQMESIHWLTQLLNARDSNSGKASCLTEAIEVLIVEAIRDHKEELERWEKPERQPRQLLTTG